MVFRGRMNNIIDVSANTQLCITLPGGSAFIYLCFVIKLYAYALSFFTKLYAFQKLRTSVAITCDCRGSVV